MDIKDIKSKTNKQLLADLIIAVSSRECANHQGWFDDRSGNWSDAAKLVADIHTELLLRMTP